MITQNFLIMFVPIYIILFFRNNAFPAVLGIEPWTVYILGNYPTTGIYS